MAYTLPPTAINPSFSSLPALEVSLKLVCSPSIGNLGLGSRLHVVKMLFWSVSCCLDFGLRRLLRFAAVSDQRDVSVREVAMAGKSASANQPQAPSQWAKFRSTIVSAIQDYLMCVLCNSKYCVQISRCEVLLLHPVSEGGEGCPRLESSREQTPEMLTIQVDFAMNGKVFAYEKATALTHLLPLQFEAYLAPYMVGATDVVLIPISFPATFISNSGSNVDGTRAFYGTRPYAYNVRETVARWLHERDLPNIDVTDDKLWVDVHVEPQEIMSNRDSYTHHSSKIVLPWPRCLVLVVKAVSYSTKSDDTQDFISGSQDLFQLAVRWRNSSHLDGAETEEDNKLVPPQIAPEVCLDFPDATTSPSDVLMQDVAADAQQAGIYPTPPDGIASQHTPASFAHDSPFISSSQSHESQAAAGTSEAAENATTSAPLSMLNVPSREDPLRGNSRSPGLPGMAEDDFDFFDEIQDEHLAASSPPLKNSMADRRRGNDNSGVHGNLPPSSNWKKSTDEQHKSASNPACGCKRALADSDGITKVANSMKTGGLGRGKLLASDRLRNANELNSKYSADGVFYRSQMSPHITPKDKEATTSTNIPRVGIPSSSSSDSETEASELSEHSEFESQNNDAKVVSMDVEHDLFGGSTPAVISDDIDLSSISQITKILNADATDARSGNHQLLSLKVCGVFSH